MALPSHFRYWQFPLEISYLMGIAKPKGYRKQRAVAHEFLKVTPGCPDEQVEVVAHEDEAQDVDQVDLAGALEKLQEGG